MDLSLIKNKRVFLTGHTGFKGSWMCQLLDVLGAETFGYSLNPPTNPSLFDIAGIDKLCISQIGDVSDLRSLSNAIIDFSPDVVIHMAAQPIVRESYRDPVLTYKTNVMGTVNVLEACRFSKTVKSIVNVTTDKVYRNNEWDRGYIENDILDGFDPYSNSKSCSELVTSSYKNAFLNPLGIAVSTCRAGNVIGGGDFAKDRIIPDCVRAMQKGEKIIVRNPFSIRPYQHVLEPICAYVLVAIRQLESPEIASNYNVGPDYSDCVSTGDLVDLFCSFWPGAKRENRAETNAPHEAGLLKLDCSKIKKELEWKPRWNISSAVEKTVVWSRAYLNEENIKDIMVHQIKEYLGGV